MGQNVDVMTITLMSTSGACVLDVLTKTEMRKDEAYSRFPYVIAVGLGSVRRQLHVVEHTLELHRELEATLDLEFGKHATFCVIGDRSTEKKALREVSFIISLKYVLFCDEPEEGDSFIEDHLDFGIRFLGMVIR